MSDERLLADFIAHRDDSSFDALVQRYGPMVYRVCRDVLGDRELAEDAFQATFLVLMRRADSIYEQASIGRWLYAVACRISRRERRRLVRLRSFERQAPAMEAAAPPDFDPADRELKPILHEEIARLPSRLRDAIVLCYFEGLTVDDAARRLGCPVGTLKSRLGKGRELLRERLTRRGLAASVLLLLMFSLTDEVSAAVPVALLDATAKAGSRRLRDVGVTRRVASMVLQEEASGRWTRIATSSGLILALLMVFGASRMSFGRRADATPKQPVAASTAVGNPLPISLPTEPAPQPGFEMERHCRLH